MVELPVELHECFLLTLVEMCANVLGPIPLAIPSFFLILLGIVVVE
jgi:hypothetical protein